MTRQILFIQGAGAGTHDEWDNRLVESLEQQLGDGYEIRYPLMPAEDDPGFAAWKMALDAEFANLSDGAIVIGHSIGGTILVNAIAADPPELKLDAIVLLAAAFVGDGGWPSDGFEPRETLGADLPKDVPVLIYHGSDDDTVPIGHAELYAKAIPQAVVTRLKGRDHQLGNDLSELAADIRALG